MGLTVETGSDVLDLASVVDFLPAISADLVSRNATGHLYISAVVSVEGECADSAGGLFLQELMYWVLC